MNFRSLKFRLIAWYAGWLTLLFLVFGVFVYASLGYYLKESLRQALARRARQVADTVQRLPLDRNTLKEEIENHFAPEANNRFTRVTVDGVVVYQSGLPADLGFNPALVPPPSKILNGESFGLRTASDGTTLLVLLLSRHVNGKHIMAEEGAAEGPLQETLAPWLAALVGGLSVLVLGAVMGGVLLVQRSLGPVDRIMRSAERITFRNLSERLPVPDTGDEIERLSITLNHMIRRLDESFQHTQRFLADASHELRTPLTVMHAELEEALEQAEDRERIRDLVASSLEEVERLRKIVEGLLALSRLDAGEALGQAVSFDLGQLVTTTAEQMCLLAEDKNISLTSHAEGAVLVFGDRSRIKQVIVNLLDNAIKYTPPGGRVDARVAAQEGRGVLEVSDNGIGIPAHAVQHLFERFYRADKARSRDLGGAGLGLSIVKAICVAHGGEVNVRSTEGEGSHFRVELPLATQSPVRPSA